MDNRIGSERPASNSRRHPTSTGSFKPYSYRGTGEDIITGPAAELAAPIQITPSEHGTDCYCPECARRRLRIARAARRHEKNRASR